MVVWQPGSTERQEITILTTDKEFRVLTPQKNPKFNKKKK